MADEHDLVHGDVPGPVAPSTRPGNGGRVEGRHAVAQSDGGVDQPDREGRSGPLAQPEIEVEQWPQAESLEHDRVTGFDAAVRGDHPDRGARCEPGREERRGARDEAVEDQGHTSGDGTEDDAGQCPDLEPTDRSEDTDRVRRVGGVAGDRLLDDGDLASMRRVIDARPAAGHVGRCRSGQDRHDRARRRGVADAHVADADEFDAGRA